MYRLHFIPLLLLFVLSILFSLPQAQQCERAPKTPRFRFLCRFFTLSNDSPIAKQIRLNESLQNDIKPVINLIEKFFAIIDRRIAEGDEKACNLPSELWTIGIPDAAADLQIGEYDNSCQSRINANEAIKAITVLKSSDLNNAMDIIRRGGNALYTAAKGIAEIPGSDDLNWQKGTYKLLNWNLRRVSQQCQVESATAIRKDGEIYIRAALTNSPIEAFEAALQRHFIEEYVKTDWSSSLPLCHPAYERRQPEGSCKKKDIVSEVGTTILTTEDGKGRISMHIDMELEDNPAVIEALRLNEIAVDQAEDSITPSNIALLALPMVMSLVPVAFLADLNTWATISYIIFTDVFSALPFLIKGVELLQTAEVRRSEMVGYHAGNKELGEIEIWVAECRGQQSFHVLGIIFIVIGVLSTVIGVSIELIAHCVMSRRRQQLGRDAEGPFGKATFDKTAFGFSGAATEEEKDRRYSTEQRGYETGKKGELSFLRRRAPKEGREAKEARELSRLSDRQNDLETGGRKSSVAAGVDSVLWGNEDQEYEMSREKQ